jgi:hypothetical protein
MGCLIESRASGRASAAGILGRVFWEGCFFERDSNHF